MRPKPKKSPAEERDLEHTERLLVRASIIERGVGERLRGSPEQYYGDLEVAVCLSLLSEALGYRAQAASIRDSIAVEVPRVRRTSQTKLRLGFISRSARLAGRKRKGKK